MIISLFEIAGIENPLWTVSDKIWNFNVSSSEFTFRIGIFKKQGTVSSHTIIVWTVQSAFSFGKECSCVPELLKCHLYKSGHSDAMMWGIQGQTCWFAEGFGQLMLKSHWQKQAHMDNEHVFFAQKQQQQNSGTCLARINYFCPSKRRFPSQVINQVNHWNHVLD